MALKYEHPKVTLLGAVGEFVQSCMDKPSCNYVDNIIPAFIMWSTGMAYEADE